jgi:S-DNA-T family DNA segregation ATPase FtsK/SpoIIIE
LPHLLCPVVGEVHQAAYVLNELVSMMLQRDRERIQEPRVVVAIDELADLVVAGGPGVARSITRLTQRGREAGLHVIACTQKPTVDAIGSLVKSNFPARLVGSVASAEDAKVASGLPGTGAEKLLGRGDFILVVKGEVVRFQAAYVSGDEVAALVGRLRQGQREPGHSRPEAEAALGVSAGAVPDVQAGTGRPLEELGRTGTDERGRRVERRPVLQQVAQQLRLIK